MAIALSPSNLPLGTSCSLCGLSLDIVTALWVAALELWVHIYYEREFETKIENKGKRKWAADDLG